MGHGQLGRLSTKLNDLGHGRQHGPGGGGRRIGRRGRRGRLPLLLLHLGREAVRLHLGTLLRLGAPSLAGRLAALAAGHSARLATLSTLALLSAPSLLASALPTLAALLARARAPHRGGALLLLARARRLSSGCLQRRLLLAVFFAHILTIVATERQSQEGRRNQRSQQPQHHMARMGSSTERLEDYAGFYSYRGISQRRLDTIFQAFSGILPRD